MKIVKYTPERRQDFVDLNVWWIEKYFGAVEQADRDEFDHVEDEITKGGMVFFAVDEADGAALATCMAIDRGEGEWEIARIRSRPAAQGLRQGRLRGVRGLGRAARCEAHLHAHEQLALYSHPHLREPRIPACLLGGLRRICPRRLCPGKVRLAPEVR